MHVNDLLKVAVESSASDLHLKVGSLPMMRVRGALLPASPEKKLDHGDLAFMPSGFQDSWQHCVPEEDVPGERVSLVFRTVK